MLFYNYTNPIKKMASVIIQNVNFKATYEEMKLSSKMLTMLTINGSTRDYYYAQHLRKNKIANFCNFKVPFK